MNVHDEPVFGELPALTKGKARWESTVAKLAANPGQWARIAECPHRGSASSVANNLRRWFPGLEVTTRWRDEDGGGGALWARWREETMT